MGSSTKKKINKAVFQFVRVLAGVMIVAAVGLYVVKYISKSQEFWMLAAASTVFSVVFIVNNAVTLSIYKVPASGEVLSTEKRVETDSDPSGNTSTSVAFVTELQYAFGDRYYQTTQNLHFKPTVGGSVDLLVDPDEPTDAILKPSLVKKIIIVVFPIVLTAAGSALVYKLIP